MELSKEQQTYQAVIQKAWEDANFKAALVADPVATIEAFTGEKVSIPAGKTLVVRDQTKEDTVYINIPATQDNVELQEEQLDAVSGGTVNPIFSTLFGPVILSQTTSTVTNKENK